MKSHKALQDSQGIKHPDAVFFDWDGTLVDSFSFLNDAHGHVLESLGFAPFREGEFKEYFGQPREVLYKRIYRDKSEEAKGLFERYVLDNTHRIAFLPGADILLEGLHRRGVRMGVVSNKKGLFVEREASHLGWAHYFSCIVGAGEASADKPSGAPLLHALEKTGLSTDSHTIWYVGDTEFDLKCAAEARCPAVFIKGSSDDQQEHLLRQYTTVAEVNDCLALHEFLVAL